MRKDNRGQVLIIVALAFVVFLGFAALAVDVAYMYTVRNELQRSADAGALAGASAFVDPLVPPLALQATARDWAKSFASQNTVAGALLNNVTDDNVDVSLADNLVRVRTGLTVDLFFARIFGRERTTVEARAAADHLPLDNTLRLVEYTW
jgi:Flp pilus assembly protein TadG